MIAIRGVSKAVLAGVLAAALTPEGVLAEGGETYQVEMGLDFESRSNDVDEMQAGLTLNWYFRPVDTSDKPVAEAEFLEHASSVGFDVGYYDLDLGNGVEGDGAFFGLRARYADDEVPVTGSARFRSSSIEFDGNYEGDWFDVGGRAGYWLLDDLEVGLVFEYEKLDVDSISLENKRTGVGVYGKRLRELSGMYVGFEGKLERVDYKAQNIDSGDNLEMEVSGDVYFDDYFSIGMGVDFSQGDFNEAEGLGVMLRSSYNAGAQFEAAFSVRYFFASDGNVEDTLTVSVGLLFRM